MIPASQLAEWRRLAAAATPGPWEVKGDGRQAFAPIGCVAKCDTQLHDDDDEEGLEEDDARARRDVAFLCAARTALPALLDEVERLEEDQHDWREGVRLIASSLGEHHPKDLSCVRLAEVALVMRARVESLSAPRSAASLADEALGKSLRKLSTPKTGPIDIVCNADLTLWRVTCGTVLAGSWQATAPTLDAAVSAAAKESDK